jgi:hypothetical protein
MFCVLVLYQVMRDNLTALSLKSHVDREAAAKTIPRVASKLEFFDPAKIHDQAMAELRDRSPPVEPSSALNLLAIAGTFLARLAFRRRRDEAGATAIEYRVWVEGYGWQFRREEVCD